MRQKEYEKGKKLSGEEEEKLRSRIRGKLLAN